MSNILYKWSFVDKKDRTPLWYIIVLSIIIGLVIWGFLTKQYGMSFVILLVAGLTFFLENNSDDEVFIEISDLGIKVGESFYEYGAIDSFTFMYSGDSAVLLRFNINKRGIRNVDLKVNNNIVSDLKLILPNYVQENTKEELSIIDKIIGILKL
ncbi:hypothetical protein CSA08_01835 [Candidatus Gracilibacteria bacterium]|nr:MAG: hypothetical protein CSA08_01835 [Candidatus Gracilibacteria bacterium]